MLADGGRIVHGTWDAASVAGGVIFLAKDNFAPVTLTTTTASNTTLTTSGSYTTSALRPGDVISGTGIVHGTFIVSIESATSLTMSNAATDSTANSRVFTRPGQVPYQVITAKVINSVSSATMTGSKITSGGICPPIVALTCVSSDAGWFSVYCQ